MAVNRSVKLVLIFEITTFLISVFFNIVYLSISSMFDTQLSPYIYYLSSFSKLFETFYVQIFISFLILFTIVSKLLNLYCLKSFHRFFTRPYHVKVQSTIHDFHKKAYFLLNNFILYLITENFLFLFCSFDSEIFRPFWVLHMKTCIQNVLCISNIWCLIFSWMFFKINRYTPAFLSSCNSCFQPILNLW